MKTLLTVAIASLSFAAAAQAAALKDQAERNKEVAAAFYNALVQRDVANIRRYGDPKYIQHNPNVPTGLDNAIAFFNSLPAPATKPPPLQFVRSIAQGDLVMFLRRVPAATPADPNAVRANVDIFRVENGKVVEHWDYMETFANGNQRGPNPPKNSNGVF